MLGILLSLLMLVGLMVPVAAATETSVTFVNPLAEIDPQTNMALAERLDIYYHDQTLTASTSTAHVVEACPTTGHRRAVYRIRDDGFWGLNNKVIAISNSAGAYAPIMISLAILLVERYPQVIIVTGSGSTPHTPPFNTPVNPNLSEGFFGGFPAAPTGAPNRNNPSTFTRQGTMALGVFGGWDPAAETAYRNIGINTIDVWAPDGGPGSTWSLQPRLVQAVVKGVNV